MMGFSVVPVMTNFALFRNEEVAPVTLGRSVKGKRELSFSSFNESCSRPGLVIRSQEWHRPWLKEEQKVFIKELG
jgi:hypothetical protein